MKSDCVLNDDELEEKRKVIINNRIKRMKRSWFKMRKISHQFLTKSDSKNCDPRIEFLS